MSRREDLTNLRFGKLKVLREGDSEHGRTQDVCKNNN